jgi:hypothetical protein
MDSMATLHKFVAAITALSLLALLPAGAASRNAPETLSGKIIRIADKHHLVVAEDRTAGMWYVRDSDKYRVGQRVTATGTVNRQGVFFPQEIRVVGTAPTPAAPVSSGVFSSCAGYRWPMKIAADPGATQIAQTPMNTTIANLVSLARPSASAIRNSPVETTLWQVVNARLTFMYVEHDRDYHLVLYDNSGHHLVAEVPDPQCARTSALLPEISRVRSAVNARFGSVRGVIRPNLTVSVRGIGFFDEYSGTTGQARNAIELHPLTAICFGANCAL